MALVINSFIHSTIPTQKVFILLYIDWYSNNNNTNSKMSTELKFKTCTDCSIRENSDCVSEEVIPVPALLLKGIRSLVCH